MLCCKQNITVILSSTNTTDKNSLNPYLFKHPLCPFPSLVITVYPVIDQGLCSSQTVRGGVVRKGLYNDILERGPGIRKVPLLTGRNVGRWYPAFITQCLLVLKEMCSRGLVYSMRCSIQPYTYVFKSFKTRR